jgi:murein DD-endopeptidase MepM/ murein hydrolase activator NlpD
MDDITDLTQKLVDEPKVETQSSTNEKYQRPVKVGKKGEIGELPWLISKFVDPKVYISQRHPHGHPAQDWGATKGTPIYPIGPGVCIEQNNYPKGGLTCKIKHSDDEGLISYYAHMGEVFVKPGQKVDFNTIIGTISDTGSAKGTQPHLHLETKLNGSYIDPDKVIGSTLGSFTKKSLHSLVENFLKLSYKI